MIESNFHQRGITSKISLAKILFEEDGGDGGDYSSYGSGEGGASKSEFYKTFIGPVADLFKAFGYTTERITNSVYYFAKKILLNIPRLFNPATPLIFKDIADEERAAKERIGKRYASVIEDLKNFNKFSDLKVMAFMLAPQQIIGAVFLKNAPVVAYKAANTLSGNKINDFVSNIKNAYYSQPAQYRSKRRIAELIRQYEDQERRSTGSRIGESVGTINSIDLLENLLLEKKQKEVIPNNVFFQWILEVDPTIFDEMLQPAFNAIKQSGQQAITAVTQDLSGYINKINAVRSSKNLEEFCNATGIDKNQILDLIEKSTEEALEKQIAEILKKEKQKELTEDEKNKLKSEISSQIYNEVFSSLKKDYLNKQNLSSVKTQLSTLLTDPNVPNEIKAEINKTLG